MYEDLLNSLFHLSPDGFIGLCGFFELYLYFLGEVDVYLRLSGYWVAPEATEFGEVSTGAGDTGGIFLVYEIDTVERDLVELWLVPVVGYKERIFGHVRR